MRRASTAPLLSYTVPESCVVEVCPQHAARETRNVNESGAMRLKKRKDTQLTSRVCLQAQTWWGNWVRQGLLRVERKRD